MASNEKTLTKWTDTEKLALCISIIKASGPPDWKAVQLPAGRTKKACFHVYNSLRKQTEGVALASPGSPAEPKPRKKAEETVPIAGKKRGRPPKVKKSVELVHHSEDEGKEGPLSKKAKMGNENFEIETTQETGTETMEEDVEET